MIKSLGTFGFTIQRRIKFSQWIKVSYGNPPFSTDKCIYIYSLKTFSKPIPAGHIIYLGQRSNASCLTKSNSLKHYRWWSKYETKTLRCDYALLEGRHFKGLKHEEERMKLGSVNSLV
jgi:hypothetical protein